MALMSFFFDHMRIVIFLFLILINNLEGMQPEMEPFSEKLALPIDVFPGYNNYKSNTERYAAKHRACQDHSHLAVYNLKTQMLLYVKKLGGINSIIKFSPHDTYLAYTVKAGPVDLEIVDTFSGRVLYSFSTATLISKDDFAFCNQEKYFRYLASFKKNDKDDKRYLATLVINLETKNNLGYITHYFDKQAPFTATSEKMVVLKHRPDRSIDYQYYPFEHTP